MVNKSTFGQFLRQKRNEKGMTQKELAEKLFLSESAICAIYMVWEIKCSVLSDSTMLSAKQTTGIRNVTLPSTRDQLQS